MIDTTAPTWIAGALPLAGIALSAWSFTFSEEGATPDEWHDPSPTIRFAGEILKRGARRSARMAARVTFQIGALCLAAAVPMGVADSHALGLLSVPAMATYAILFFGLAYGARSALTIWQDRRECVFDAFYYGHKLYQFYRNEKAIRQFFFGLNPGAWWEVYRRDWFARTFIQPTPEQLLSLEGASEADE